MFSQTSNFVVLQSSGKGDDVEKFKKLDFRILPKISFRKCKKVKKFCEVKKFCGFLYFRYSDRLFWLLAREERSRGIVWITLHEILRRIKKKNFQFFRNVEFLRFPQIEDGTGKGYLGWALLALSGVSGFEEYTFQVRFQSVQLQNCVGI